MEGKMKTMKLIYPLAFALTVMLATTGCHNHQPVGITPLPGSPGATPNDQNNFNTMPMPQPASSPGGVPTASLEEFENMVMDRAALAAYTVHFAYDSAVVRKSEHSNLEAVASALSADASTKLLIEGHCDERGTEEYNRSLGERRALALREALAKMGVDPSRVRTISYGKDRPVDPGHDETAWAKNRRGEFVLLHPKASS
jgi:peptidoglycan-associated lipoprotein